MHNSLKFILMSLVTIFLFGCASTPERIVDTRVETKYIAIPKSMLIKPNITAPISKTEYLALNDREAENALADYIVKLLGDIKLYGIMIDNIVMYQERQLLELKRKNE